MNVRPSMYFVEAPSTMNELLLAQHLLATNDDKRMRRWSDPATTRHILS